MKMTISFGKNEIAYINRAIARTPFADKYDPQKVWETRSEQNPGYTTIEAVNDDGYNGELNLDSEFLFDMIDLAVDCVVKVYSIGRMVSPWLTSKAALLEEAGKRLDAYGTKIKKTFNKYCSEEQKVERAFKHATKLASKMRRDLKDKADKAMYLVVMEADAGKIHLTTAETAINIKGQAEDMLKKDYDKDETVRVNYFYSEAGSIEITDISTERLEVEIEKEKIATGEDAKAQAKTEE